MEWPLFAGLDREEVDRFLVRCARLAIQANERLMTAGEPAEECYLIMTGRVDVRVRAGREQATVASLGPGQLVGEMGLYHGHSRRVADVVVSRPSSLMRIPYSHVRRLASEAPALEAKLRHNLEATAQGRLHQVARARIAALEMRPADADLLVDAMAGQGGVTWSAAGDHDADAPALVPVQIRLALARSPLFCGAGDEVLGLMVERVRPVRYAAGQPIVMAGEPADSLFFVALGRLSVVVEVDGTAQVVAQLRVGECFGEAPLAHGVRLRDATVLADTPATLLRLGYGDLHEVVASRPEARSLLGQNLMNLVANRLGPSTWSWDETWLR